MKRFIMGVIAYFIFAGAAFAAGPQVMTYQGRLKESGLPVTGDRDIIITLCDAPSAGSCYPAVPTAQTVYVSTGLFKSTFTLPSGADLSTGEWYLQVNVDTVDLLPREKLTAVPYALYSSSSAYAENAASAVLRTGDTMTGQLTTASTITVSGGAFSVGVSTFVVEGGIVGIRTASPQAALDVVSTGAAAGVMAQLWRDSGGVIVGSMSATGDMQAARFVGDGSGLTGVTGATGDDPNALKLAGGNMTGQLTTASTITVQGAAFSVGGSTLVVSGGAVGIGVAVPTAAFQVNGDWIMGSDSDFPGGGVAGWLHSPSGVLYEGGGVAWSHHFAAYGGGDIARFGVSAASGDTPDTRAVITNAGWLGVGTGSPAALLHVSSAAGESGTLMAVSTGATNLFWVTGGGAHASRFVGDGSGLTNLPVGAIGGVIPVAQGGTGLASIAPDNLIYASAADTFAAAPLSPFARTLLDDGTVGEARTTLGLTIGADVQAYDADLDDLADGSLTGSKVGPGVPAANIADGALGANVVVSSLAVASVHEGALLNPKLNSNGDQMDGYLWVQGGTFRVLAPDSQPYSLAAGTGTVPSHLHVSTMGGVGLGTVVPEAVLDVRGDILARTDGPLAYRFLNAAGTDGVVIDTSNGAFRTAAAASYSLGSLAQPWKQLVIGGGAVSSIDGSLGIGTSSPATRFQVENGSISITGSEPALLFGSGETRVISQDTDAATGAGIEFSTNVYIVGFSSAARYFGDGSALTGVLGTDPDALPLAGGVMAGTLDMGGNSLAGVSTITVLNGSVAIVPPGTGGSNYGYGVSIGSNAYNNYGSGIGIGYGAYSNYDGGVGLGSGASNNYMYGVGVGLSAGFNYTYGTGVGRDATNNNNYGVGVGYYARDNYTYGVGLGNDASSNYSYGVGVGKQAKNNKFYAVGVGAYSQDNQPYGAALGAYSYAASSSVALGYGARANAWNSVAIGSGTVNNSTGTASFGILGVYTSSGVYAAEFVGNGSGLTGVSSSDNTKLPLAGGTLTGNLALSASTMSINATGSFANLITAGLTGGATMIMYADLSSAGLFTVNATDRLKIGAGMTETLTVANGRVGINNQPSPVAALQVSGTTKLLADPATGYLLVAGSAARPDMFFISSSGVVGVGDFSSSPASTDTLVNISPVLRSGGEMAVGLQVYARSEGGGIVAVGEETGIVAANFEAAADGEDAMENLAGLRAQIRREGAGSGVVQQAAAIWVDDFHHEGGGTTVNTYGLRISSLTVAGQTNAPYAIYSEDPGARVYFAGNVGISSVPAYALAVSSATGDILWVSSHAVHGMKFIGDGSELANLPVPSGAVQKSGDFMGGQLTTASTITVQGDAFSVGGPASFAIKGGSVAIGVEPGWARLHLLGDNSDNGTFVMEQVGDGVASRIMASRTRGTLGGMTAVQNGDAIFDIRYDGHDGGNNVDTDWIENAIFRGVVDGAVSDGVVPIGFEFHTSSATDSDLHTRLAIRSDGRVQIGTTSVFPALLEVRDYASQYPYLLALGTGPVSSQVLVSTSGSVGIGVSPSTESVFYAHKSHGFTAGGEEVALGIQASAYGWGSGDMGEEGDAVAGADFHASVHSDASLAYLVGIHTEMRREDSDGGTGAGTIGKAIGLYLEELENKDVGAGAITDTYGIYISSLTVGRQTNAPYAIYSEDAGARTYLAGNLGISSATPTAALVVSSAAGSSDLMLVVSTGSSIVFGVKGNGEVYTAGRFIGDGSGLSNINVTGDGLGSHIATTTLLMGPYGINTSSSITAGVYQIAGSTVLAMPPGPANIAVGEGAGYANASGGYNLFAGGDSGRFTRTGSANTLLGYRAGYGTDGGSFSSSTVVGYEAGYFMGAGAEGNTLLGWRAGYGIISGTGNIVIGYGQGLQSGSDNNKLNIGGVLFGDLARRTIGISTRTPNAALDINSSTESPFALLVSTAPDRPILAVSTAGYVYVGGVHDSTITLMSVEARLGDPFPGQEDIRVALSARVDTDGSGFEDIAAAGNFEVEIRENDLLNAAVALRTAVDAEDLSQVGRVIGLLVERPENSGTIQRTFGVYIATQTALTGTQSQVYGLYSEDPAAYNYFGGRVGIGTSSPQEALQIAEGNVLLDDDRTINWGLPPAPYITGNDSSGLLAFGLAGTEKFKIQEPAVTVLNADLVISTNSGSRGIVFQDKTVQTSAPPKTVLIYKPADTNITSDDVPDLDPDLQFNVGPDEKWQFEAVLYAHTNDTGFNTDFRAGLIGPAENLLRWDYSFYAADGVAQTSGGVLNGYGVRPVDWTAGVIASGTRLVIRGTIDCAAAGGPFGITWSQNLAGPFTTTVLAGSYLKAQRVR